MPDLDTSALEDFSLAKRKIGEVFEDIDQQIEAVQTFIETVQRLIYITYFDIITSAIKE